MEYLDLDFSTVELMGVDASPENDHNITFTTNFELECSEQESALSVTIGSSKRRRAYSAKEKQDVIKRYDQLRSMSQVSTETGINRRLIQTR